MLLAIDGQDLPLPTSLDSGSLHAVGGIAPVVAAMAVLVSLLLVWAVFFRKPQRRRERGRLIEPKAGAKALTARESGAKSGRRRRRRERLRPRNSTLAETGGLPPLGTGDSKPPP